MPQRCINPGCYGETNGSVFQVPKNIDRREKWLKAVRHVYPNLDVKENFRVCEKHFRKTDFTSYIADKSGKIVQEVTVERKRLRQGAVPYFDVLNLDSGNEFTKTILTEQDKPRASTSGILEPHDMIGEGSPTSTPLKEESATNMAYGWMDSEIHFDKMFLLKDECEDEELHAESPPPPRPRRPRHRPRRPRHRPRRLVPLEAEALRRLRQPDNRHLSFVRGILPTLDSFSDLQTLRFQRAVLDLICQIKYGVEHYDET